MQWEVRALRNTKLKAKTFTNIELEIYELEIYERET